MNKKVNDEVYKLLKEGSFFGEIALLTKLKRTATLRSSDYTNCAFLNSADLDAMELHFAHIVQ